MLPNRTVYLFTSLIAAAYALSTWRSGIHTGPDTATYSRWADLLIANHFNVSSYLREQSFVVPPVLYLAWIYVVAVMKTALGPSWMAGVVILNVVALITGAYLTLRVVRELTQSAAGLVLSTFLFLAAIDLLIFVPFVLSDLMFWGMSTGVLALGVTIHRDERDGRVVRTVIAGSALTAIAFAFRPAALPLVAFWMTALLAGWWPDVVLRRSLALFTGAAALAFIAIAAHAYLLMHPSAWTFGSLPGMLKLLAEEYRGGVLVYAPNSNLTVAPATDWLGVIRLTLEKLLYFLTPWLPHYSRLHTMMNLAFFVPVYGLAASAVANFGRLTERQRLAVWLLAIYALFLTVFHALMQIDYDHRYRLPMLPALIMLAAIGLESVRRPRRLSSTARTK